MEFDPRDFSWLIALGVFAAYFWIDVLYASYTISVVERQAGRAAFVSMGMYLLLALGVLTYVSNAIYLLPLALGAWSGTYVGVRFHRDRSAG